MDITAYIDDIESRIDEAQEQRMLDAWIAYARGENADGPFDPPRRTPRPSRLEWKHIPINAAVEDEELMLLSQLERLNARLAEPSDRLLCIRANYGVGNLPSLFGAERFLMPEAMDTLPNVRPIPGGVDGIVRLIEAPDPSPLAGNGAKIDAMGRVYAKIRETHPKIGRFVRIDHPDGQGPMDVCELLWGSDLFYSLYDEPEIVHALLRKVTDAYKRFMDHWFTRIPSDGYCCYFGELALGGVFLRDDSAMNLSPEMYDEFIFPYDSELLEYYGGGGIHFCGRGDHFIERLSQTPGLTAVNLSQPHLNDMQRVLACTIDKGVTLRSPRSNYSLEGHDARRLYNPVYD